MPIPASWDWVTAASRRDGAISSTRKSSPVAMSLEKASVMSRPHERVGFADEGRDAREHAAKIAERLPHPNAAVQPEFPDGPLVPAGAVFGDRDRLPDFSIRLEKAEQDHHV